MTWVRGRCNCVSDNPWVREGQVGSIGDAVDRYLRKHGLLRLGREALIPVIWGEVVGAWYQRHTQVIRVDKGVLTVRCDSAARAQQLQLDSAAVMARLNERLKAPVVKEIRPTSGGILRGSAGAEADLSGAPRGPRLSDLAQIDLTPQELDWIAEITADIDEEPLRTRAHAVLAKRCKVERWKRERGYRPCEICGVLVAPGKRTCRGCNPGRIPSPGNSEALPPWRDKPWGW